MEVEKAGDEGEDPDGAPALAAAACTAGDVASAVEGGCGVVAPPQIRWTDSSTLVVLAGNVSVRSDPKS